MRSLALLSSLLLLTACSQKSDVEDAINAYFGDEVECYPGDSVEPRLPLRISQPLAAPPIVQALISSNLVTTQPDLSSFQPRWLIDLSPAGQEAQIWTQGKGFCYGRKRVLAIDKLDDLPQLLTAHFTWQYEAPDWARQNLRLPGIAAPAQGVVVFDKTKDGLKLREP